MKKAPSASGGSARSRRRSSRFSLPRSATRPRSPPSASPARFGQLYPVVLGTTLGMLLANIPVVFIGDRIAGRLPVKTIRIVAAGLFALLGVLTTVRAGR